MGCPVRTVRSGLLIPLIPNNDLLLYKPYLFYGPLFLLFQPFVFEVSLLSHIDNFPVSNVLLQ